VLSAKIDSHGIIIVHRNIHIIVFNASLFFGQNYAILCFMLVNIVEYIQDKGKAAFNST
jgi:hypothetical protein